MPLPSTTTRPTLHRRSRLTADLVLDRTVGHDDERGVYVLTARRRIAPIVRPLNCEQIEVWRRWERLRDELPARRVVTWMPHGTLLQRLAKLRRRLETRRARFAGKARLEGALS